MGEIYRIKLIYYAFIRFGVQREDYFLAGRCSSVLVKLSYSLFQHSASKKPD